MKKKTMIGLLCLSAITAGMIPYKFDNDKETGEFEVRSFLWGLKKTIKDDRKYYSFAMPSSGLDREEELEEIEDGAPAEVCLDNE